MDVSAISAFNPNKINWRSMTAKQILKYEKQGVEVPNVYLQWANEFMRNVEKYDNDEVTYENAKSSQRHANKSGSKATAANNPDDKIAKTDSENETKTETVDKTDKTTDTDTDAAAATNAANTEAAGTQATDTEQSTGEDETEQQDTSVSAAQAKRKQMSDNGVSLRNQAISFTSDSKQTGDNAKAQELVMNIMKSSSENEIQELESEMKSLLAEAESKQSELKKEVANINDGKSNNSTFSKIEQLQKELEKYGQDAQSQTAQAGAVIDGYGVEIDGASEIFGEASDFGTETMGVGNDLIAQAKNSSFMEWYRDVLIGRIAVSTGGISIQNAQSGESAQNEAKSSNTQAKSQINSLKNEIHQKTGVAAQNEKEEGSASEQDPITGEQKESLKDVKTSQNDGTDTSDKMNLSLDEIVKRKVRRGDYSQEV